VFLQEYFKVQFCTYIQIGTEQMTRIQRLTGNEAAVRGGSATPRASKKRARSSGAAVRSGRRREINAAVSGGRPKKGEFSLQGMKIADLYRPLKKPVTLRLDADVLAWFKKDGRRYQTRINQALRKVMEREMKSTQ
jgi:uncharacterized protein (DUF4415 family)